MAFYKVYAVPLTNNIGDAPVYVQSIEAKSRRHACISVATLPENMSFYRTDTYFAVKDVKSPGGPKTWEEVLARGRCEECGHVTIDEVYAETCSVICVYCNRAVFFVGRLQGQESSFVCPYCSKKQFSSNLGKQG